MGSGFLKKKKQARMFQEQLSSMQGALTEKLEKLEVTGTSGNGLVHITLNGSHEMRRIAIKPECVDPEDIEGLETLIKAAYLDAYNQLKAQTESPSMDDLPNFSALGF